MGAIPPGVATQSAAGTPSTADYYGKKNIYIYAYGYNNLSMGIYVGAAEVKSLPGWYYPKAGLPFCVGG